MLEIRHLEDDSLKSSVQHDDNHKKGIRHRGRDIFFGMRPDFLLYPALSIIILSLYWQVIDHQFVYDDICYITENLHVQKGLTLENIVWSLTANVAGNWHPLTLLSHMIDCQFYGLNPSGHHVTNLLFHIANTFLLFFIIKRMTNALWQSAFVAALFAIHPLHVESVAWVSERKDVLSTFFWLLTMWSYFRYTRRPGLKRYLPVLVLLVLGLMSKPMLVTLPFVLLLLDYWPLNRFDFGRPGLLRLVLEKTPLFIVVAVSSIITFHFQKAGGAVAPLDIYPLFVRLINVLLSYANYIINMIWPLKLAVFYPYPKEINVWQLIGSCLILLSMTFFALKVIKEHAYVAVGWFWYLGTLVPVIGLVHVGAQSMADRYTYVPLIGIFIILAWGVPDLLSRWQHNRKALAITTATLLSVLAATTFMQVRYWKNSITLFEHALRVTTNNHVAHSTLGVVFLNQGRYAVAGRHLSEALRIRPGYDKAHNNLGAILIKQGKYIEATMHLSVALRVSPRYAEAHNNMGVAMQRLGKINDAVTHYSEAVKINPGYLSARKNLDAALLKKKNIAEASQINHEMAEEYLNRGQTLSRLGHTDEAIKHINSALKLNPDSAKAHFMLGNIQLGKGETKEAVSHFQETLRIDNNYAEAHTNLGYALHALGKKDEAVKHCLEAIRLKPDTCIDAYYNLACIYATNNETKESVAWLKKAIGKGFSNWDLLKSDKDLENIRNTPYYIKTVQQQRQQGLKDEGHSTNMD